MSTQVISRQSSKEKTVKKCEDIHQGQKDVFPPESTSSIVGLQRMVADPRTARLPEILALQRKYGNEAVQRLLATHNLQAKLTVGAANDTYEQEADRVAAQVMSAPEHTPDVQRQGEEEEEIQAKPLAATITPLVQRQPVEEEEEEPLQGRFLQRQSLEEEEEEPLQGKFIQRQPLAEEEEEPLQGKFMPGRETFAPGTDFESRLAATHGGGSPLPRSTREFMEQRFGAGFGNVRLHTGSESAKLNREVSAQAFTRGQDIYLAEGKSNVESGAGRQLLAHELTHVVQQTGAQNKTGPRLQRLQQAVIQRLTTAKDFKTATTLNWRGKSDAFFKRIYGKMDEYEAASSDADKLRLLKEILTEAKTWLASDAAKTSRRKDPVAHLATELEKEITNLTPSPAVSPMTTPVTPVPARKGIRSIPKDDPRLKMAVVKPRAAAPTHVAPPSTPLEPLPTALTNLEILAIPAKTFAARRNASTFGIGEIVNLTTSASPPADTTIKFEVVNGEASMSRKQAHQLVIGARGGEITIQMKVETGKFAGRALPKRLTLHAVAPAGAATSRQAGTNIWHVHDTASVGFKMHIGLLPADVPFGAVEFREDVGLSTATGAFSSESGRIHAPTGVPYIGNQPAPDPVNHPKLARTWVPVDPDDPIPNSVMGVDEVSTGAKSPISSASPHRWSPGKMDWDIQWVYHVKNSASVINLMKARHEAKIEESGQASIKKAGSGPFQNNAADADQSY